MVPLKTYSHLLQQKRKASDYEIVCSDLLYYPQRGFEVNTPLAQWYENHQRGSPLKCKNWEQFYDPRETTYTKYTNLQKEKEIFVDGVFASIDETEYDNGISESWLDILALMVAPLRYPWHGFQMIASYIGQLAPSGRIVITSMFQAADEMRRIQRVAYRIRQLQATHSGFGLDSQSIWEKMPLWQPLRKVIEKLLVTYDWGESLIALNFVVKPLVDSLFIRHFGNLSRSENDELLGEIFYSIGEDCRWHKQWNEALMRTVILDTPENGQIILEWSKKWYPLAIQAVTPFAQFIDNARGISSSGSQTSTLLQLENEFQENLNTIKINNGQVGLEIREWK